MKFYPLEQTRLSGVDYLLVSDAEEGDGEAWILRDVSPRESEEAVYEIVEDELTLSALGKIFSEELGEEGIGLEIGG